MTGRTCTHVRPLATHLTCIVDHVNVASVVDVSSVLVSGLRPSTAYKLIVYAENGVTLTSGAISADDIDVITDVAGSSLFHRDLFYLFDLLEF